MSNYGSKEIHEACNLSMNLNLTCKTKGKIFQKSASCFLLIVLQKIPSKPEFHATIFYYSKRHHPRVLNFNLYNLINEFNFQKATHLM